MIWATQLLSKLLHLHYTMPMKAAFHKGLSHCWGRFMAKSSFMIGSLFEVGLKGFTWGIKANNLKLYHNKWETNYNTTYASTVDFPLPKPTLDIGPHLVICLVCSPRISLYHLNSKCEYPQFC